MPGKLRINTPSLGFRIFNVALFMALAATMILPIWRVLVISFSSNLESYQMSFRFWPARLSLDGYINLMTLAAIWRPFLNNVYVTVLGVLGHVLLNALGGFVLARSMFAGKRIIWAIVLVPIFVPFEAIIIPRYLVYKALGLIDTLNAVAINGMVSTFSIFLMRNYFSAVPRELEDSAEIDGARLFAMFRHVYLPLSTAALATIALMETVGKWNTLFSAVLFLNSPAKYTLQLALINLIVEQTSAFASGLHVHNNVRAAGVVVALLPLVLTYPFLQRYFIKGIFLGSVKG